MPPEDAALVDACGDSPGAICEWVWNATGNDVLAGAADWVIGKPLKAIFIILVAAVTARLARRAIRRGVRRLVAADRDTATRALQRVGMASGDDVPRREARASSIATVVASTASVLIWVVATLLVLGEIGIDLAPLIAGAGIAGIAIGFGAQNLVKDCVAGLFMLIEDQYGIGDAVDLGVAIGSVEQITLRATVLRGQDGTVWHVPNGEIRRVGNRSKLWSVAVVDVIVAYDADLVATRRVVHDVAADVTASDEYAGIVLEAPEILGVETVTAEGVTLRLLVKTSPGAQFRLQRALREALKAGLDDAGIDVLPTPPRTPSDTMPSDDGA
ncbi:MAG: mechanosensitive ion channel domain-containing protein [Ilumatobacteraceae bacterium]